MIKQTKDKTHSISFGNFTNDTQTAYLNANKEPHGVHLTHIETSTTYQRQGKASELLNSLTDYCIENNLNDIRVDVPIDNEATCKLLESNGYTYIGEWTPEHTHKIYVLNIDYEDTIN